jgi:uncharacterized protein
VHVRGHHRRHPATAFLLLTYVISWGGALAVGWAVGFEFPTPESALPVFFPLLLGPPVAGLLLTAVTEGRTGLRALGGRLLHWRVPARWYLAALLPAPVILGGVLLVLSAFDGAAYRPGFLWIGLAFGLSAGLLEEVGWTGVATPALRRRHGVWGTGVLLGLVWGVWHLLPTLLVHDGPLTGGWLPMLVVHWVVGLTAYRMLIVWVHEHTGSVLIAGLMHGGYTASLMVLEPPATGGQELTWKLAFALVLCVAALAAFLRQRTRFPPGTPSSPGTHDPGRGTAPESPTVLTGDVTARHRPPAVPRPRGGD